MKRAKHSLSHYKLLSCDMGTLIPIGLTEALPGDSIQQSTTALLRMSPMLAPVMHPVHARIHHWFVPHRLVWDDWEDFITGGPDGMDDSVFPTVNTPASTGVTIGSLADYLGVPNGVPGIAHSALPYRGYALIFNEWYRDQDLVTPLTISTASGPDTTTNTTLQNIAWEKDYFTSSRPWEQKGPAITVPIGNQAPVYGIGKLSSTNFDQTSGTVNMSANGGSAQNATMANTDGNRWSDDTSTLLRQHPTILGSPNIYADLTSASALTINSLREAFALQRFEEARARYGSRYTEYLRYLGVKSSDARLQRPEYLGGGKQTIQFSEVLATAESDDTPIGSLKGHGIGAMRSNRYRRYFEEHGYIFSFLSIRPRTMYVQGLARHWNRRIKEDFWQRELQHIGQQEVLKKELYLNSANPEATFGYQDRYDEYRRTESSIAGEFRTSVLDYWHMARVFASEPSLNSAFVQCNPTERIFADNQEATVYVMANHSIQARRLVAATGNSFIY